MKQLFQNYGRTVFFACAFLVCGLFSMDLYTPALPSILKNLHLPHYMAPAMAMSFFWGLGLSLIVYGLLADYIGRKNLVLMALVFAILGNLLLSLSSTEFYLILFRFITGIGSGGCLLMAGILLKDRIANKALLVQGFAIFAMFSQLSPAIAPSIGGALVHYFDWQMDFVFLSILSFILFTIVFFVFRDDFVRTKKLNFKPNLGITKNLLQNKTFFWYSIMSGFIMGFIMNYFTFAPFMFELQYHIKPIHTGLCLLVMPVGLILGALMGGQMAKLKLSGEKRILFTVILFSILGLVFIGILSFVSNIILLLSFGLFFGFTCGLLSPQLNGEIMMLVEAPAAILNATRSVLKMLTAAVVMAVSMLFHIHSLINLAELFFVLALVMLGMNFLAVGGAKFRINHPVLPRHR